MNKKILVPLGQYDRSDEMIPYIENVACGDESCLPHALSVGWDPVA
jgi:hypothetical protein